MIFFSLELHDPVALNYPFFSAFTFFRLLLILLEVIHFSPFLLRFFVTFISGILPIHFRSFYTLLGKDFTV